MNVTATVLAKVEDARFQKAVEGIRNGTYHVSITLRSEEEIRGFVRSFAGKTYGCTITQAGAFCSCPDALYRGNICKHAVVLALYDVRHPPTILSASVEEQKPRPKADHGPDLKLVKVRRDFAFSP